MLSFALEQELFDQGYKIIGGVDEAGRGPLAGPVVAACVTCKNIFSPLGQKYEEIKDSKKISEKRREELFDYITTENNFTIGVGICDHTAVDRLNILQATFLAMKKAISALKYKPEFLLIDGNKLIPNLTIKQQPIINGDESIFLIAAASIIAKVSRDRIMRKLHKQYPQYNFFKHKGYGTKEHLGLLQQLGPCLIHRKTFSPLRHY